MRQRHGPALYLHVFAFLTLTILTFHYDAHASTDIHVILLHVHNKKKIKQSSLDEKSTVYSVFVDESESVMLEPEKLRNRGKQGWLDAG